MTDNASDSMVTFELQGHSYRVVLHAPSTFGLFATKLVALASGPVLTLLNLAGSLGGLAGGEVELSSLSPEQVQKSLLEIVKNVSEEELRQIFEHTVRDGKALSEDINYDTAYRGNWKEWYLAIYHILQANGFMDFLPTPTE